MERAAFEAGEEMRLLYPYTHVREIGNRRVLTDPHPTLYPACQVKHELDPNDEHFDGAPSEQRTGDEG